LHIHRVKIYSALPDPAAKGGVKQVRIAITSQQLWVYLSTSDRQDRIATLGQTKSTNSALIKVICEKMDPSPFYSGFPSDHQGATKVSSFRLLICRHQYFPDAWGQPRRIPVRPKLSQSNL
jgi:hypothetical protein